MNYRKPYDRRRQRIQWDGDTPKLVIRRNTKTKVPDGELGLLGEHIRRLRVKRGWLQDDLAEQVGVSRTSITNIEKGRQNIPISLLLKIAAVFDQQVGDFLTDAGYTNREKGNEKSAP